MQKSSYTRLSQHYQKLLKGSGHFGCKFGLSIISRHDFRQTTHTVITMSGVSVLSWALVLCLASLSCTSGQTTWPPTGNYVYNISGSAMVIQSPNYPDNYPANSNLKWTFYAGTGWVTVVFIDMEIQNAFNCSADHMEFKAVQWSWKRYECQQNMSSYSAQVNPGNMEVTFRTDGATEMRGFRAVVVETPSNNYWWSTLPTQNCPDKASIFLAQPDVTQFFTLITWPNNYYGGVSCKWQVSAPSDDYVIRLIFYYFNTVPSQDVMSIWNGAEENGQCPDKEISGEHIAEVGEWISNGDQVYIEFNTKVGGQKGGFYIGYEAITKGNIPPTDSECVENWLPHILGGVFGGLVLLALIIGLSVWCKKSGRCDWSSGPSKPTKAGKMPLPRAQQNQPRRMRRMQHPTDEAPARQKPPRVITHSHRAPSRVSAKSLLREGQNSNFHDSSFNESQANQVSFPGTIDYI